MCGSRGSKSRHPKAASAAPADQMRDECMPLGREAHLKVKKLNSSHSNTFGSCNVGTVHAVVAQSTFVIFLREKAKDASDRGTFGSWDVERVHAVVGRSTFASENAKNIARLERVWKLRCRLHAAAPRRTSRSQHVASSPAPDHVWKLRCRENARRCVVNTSIPWQSSLYIDLRDKRCILKLGLIPGI